MPPANRLGLFTDQERDDEHEPRALQPRPTPGAYYTEQFSTGQCATCLAWLAIDCTCCVDCNRPATIGKWCEAHELAHRMTVEREQSESLRLAEWAEMQCAAEGV